MKILTVIVGHGGPNYDIKKSACQNNISVLLRTAPPDCGIDFEILHYDDSPVEEDYKYVDNLIVKKVKGFVGQHIFNHVQPEKVSNYDKLILLLDDVALPFNFNLHDFIKAQDLYDLDVISPSLSSDSKMGHQKIITRPDFKNSIRIVRCLEMFFYLFSTKKGVHDSYQKYYSLFTEDTCSMWGIDYAMTFCLKLKCGLVNDITMKHLFLCESNGQKLESVAEWSRLNQYLKQRSGCINLDFTNHNAAPQDISAPINHTFK